MTGLLKQLFGRRRGQQHHLDVETVIWKQNTQNKKTFTKWKKPFQFFFLTGNDR
jgi:hypothetical protein